MSAEGKAHLLIANSQADGRTSLSRDLASLGYSVRTTSDLARVVQGADSGTFDLVLLDVDLFDARQNGFDVLRRLVRDHPKLPVLAMGAENTVLSSLLAARFGAKDYFAKPYSFGQLASAISQQLQPNTKSQTASSKPDKTRQVIGHSTAMQEAVRRIGRAMKSRFPVLFSGDAGSGKRTLAKTLVEGGNSPDWTQIDMNVAPGDIPAIWHEAVQSGSPVFLYRIDRYPDKLVLAVLSLMAHQNANSPRLISTYCHVQTAEQPNGPFAEFLDHLNVLEISVPGIIDRHADLSDLAQQFLADTSSRSMQFSPDGLLWLAHAERFANIRAFRNFIIKAAQFADGQILTDTYLQELYCSLAQPDNLQKGFSGMAAGFLAGHTDTDNDLYRQYIQIAETPLIQQAMQSVHGNQVKAAKLLGINRNTLRKKLEALDAHKKP